MEVPEHGLSPAFLWLYGSTLHDFQPGAESLLWVDTVNYILGNFKTVDEVRATFTKEGSGSLKVEGIVPTRGKGACRSISTGCPSARRPGRKAVSGLGMLGNRGFPNIPRPDTASAP